MDLRTTRPGSASRQMRTIAALAAVVVVGATGVPTALAGTTDQQDGVVASDVQPADEQTADAAGADAASTAATEVGAGDGGAATPAVEAPPAGEPTTGAPAAGDPGAERPEQEPVDDQGEEVPAAEQTAPEAPAPVVAPPEDGPRDQAVPDGGPTTSPAPSTAPLAPAPERQAVAAASTYGLVATADRDGDVVVTWDAGPNAGSSWEHYHLWITDNAGFWQSYDTPYEFRSSWSWTFTGVPAGTYDVVVTDDGPFETVQVVVPEPTTAPDSPGDVAVAQPTPGTALVSWSAPASTGTAELQGYRVTVDGVESDLLPAGTTSLALDDLQPGAHTVSVVAVTADGTSKPGTAGFDVQTAPSAPTQVLAGHEGDGTVSVTWAAPEQAGYPALDRYVVWLDDDASTRQEVSAAELSTTLTGVAPGNRTVHVAAAGALTGASASAVVVVTAAPSPPLRPVATVAGRGSVALSWQPPADAGYPGVGGYAVLVDGRLDRTVDASRTDVVLDGVAAGARTFSVVALSKAGDSDAATVGLTVPSLPSAPLQVAAQQTGPTSVLVTWLDPEDPGTSGVTGYRVTAEPQLPLLSLVDGLGAALPPTLEQEVGSDTREWEFTGLQAGTAYDFSVTALTAEGAGDTAGDQEQTDPWAVPSAPTAVSATQTGPAQVTVTFGAPAEEGTSPVTGYVLGLSSEESDGYQEFGADVREIQVDDLAPGRYLLQLVAVNEEGVGEPVRLEVVVEATEEPDGTPDAPVAPVVANAPVRSVDAVPAPVTATGSEPTSLARTGTEAGTVALGGVLMLLLGAGGILLGRRWPAPRA